MNNKESVEKGGQYLKYIVGILFLAFVGGLVSSAAWEIFVEDYQDVPSIYIFWGVWAVILYLYLLNTEPIEYLQHKETVWEARSRRVGELCSYAFFGFLGTIGSLAVLGMVFQWILEIDISEFDTMYRLIFLTWGGWIIGLHVWFREQEKRKSQIQ